MGCVKLLYPDQGTSTASVKGFAVKRLCLVNRLIFNFSLVIKSISSQALRDANPKSEHLVPVKFEAPITIWVVGKRF